jgi:hypothetical protein
MDIPMRATSRFLEGKDWQGWNHGNRSNEFCSVASRLRSIHIQSILSSYAKPHLNDDLRAI